jgi:hypothetical protein
LAAALAWAKDQPVRVARNGEDYVCWEFQHNKPPGIAALLERPELKAIANDALKELFDLEALLAEALEHRRVSYLKRVVRWRR